MELHLKHAARLAKLCARQLLHIQSPDRKFSGAEEEEEGATAGGPPPAAELSEPPALRCLHLKHADLDAKLCARHPVQIQSPGRKLPAVGPPAGSGVLDPPPPPPEPNESAAPEPPDPAPKLPPPPPPPLAPPTLPCLHLKHTLLLAKLCA